MKKIIQPLIALLAVSILAGCAHVETSTSRFHNLPEIGNGGSFTFLPTEDQRGGLEYDSYCERIKSKLIEYGWIPSNNQQTADYLVFFTYSIDGGDTVSGSRPIYGQTGGGTSYSSGTVNSYGGSANYSGTTYTAPTYGQVGSTSYNSKVFGRNLNLVIFDEKKSSKDNPVKVYEGRATSHGSSSDIAVVLPTMIESLFKNFPYQSGKTKKVSMLTVK